MRKHATGYVLIAAAALLLYLPTLGHGFVWDDRSLLASNRFLRDPHEAIANLTGDFFRRSDDPEKIGHWRPLVTLSFMTDATIHGDRPAGWHLTNVLLHVLASALVLAVGRRLPLSRSAALAGAMLFAVHPVHVESVAWISGRTDLLCAVFAFSAVALDLRYARTGGAGSRAASIACTTLALSAKEMAIVVPAVVAWRAAWIGGARDGAISRGRAAARAAAPHLVAAAAYAVVRIAVLGIVPRSPAAAAAGRPALFWTWWSAFLDDLRALAWPAAQSITPGVGLETSPLSWRVIAGAAAFAAVAWTAWSGRTRRPGLALASAFFLASLAPLTNFVVPIRASASVAFPWAERFLYIPSLGFCLAAGWVLVEWPATWAGRKGARWGAILLVAAALACGARTFVRSADWKDELTLFGRDAADHPRSAAARYGYGVALQNAGRDDDAAAEYRAALDLAPRATGPRFNLGNLLLAKGDLVGAEAAFRQVAALDPHHAKSRLNLGIVLVRAGRPEEALAAFRDADAAGGGSIEAKVDAAHVLRSLGRPADAVPLYEAALADAPALYEARLGLAGARLESGDPAAAERLLRDLVRERPGFVPARLALGAALDAEGRGGEAEAEYREVLRLEPRNETAKRRLER